MRAVLGVDLSLTSTGLALAVDGNIELVTKVTSKGTKADSLTTRWHRMNAIGAQIVTMAGEVDLVVIEGPSLGQARQAGVHDRSGLWWLVVNRILFAGTPVAVAPPACRAKYATGKGNADKDLVLASVVRRYQDQVLGWQISKNDEADAVILAAMGSRYVGEPVEESLPESHLKGMDGVAWP